MRSFSIPPLDWRVLIGTPLSMQPVLSLEENP